MLRELLTVGGSGAKGKKGAWLEVRDPEQCTPLHCAAAGGNARAAQLLLEAGARIDATDSGGATPLHKACLHNHAPTVGVLLAAGARRDATDAAGRTPLHYAVEHDSVAVLDTLLQPRTEAGALLAAVDARGASVLHRAARRGSRRCLARIRTRVAALLADGAATALDADSLAPLHHAALAGSASCVRQLLGLGASLDALAPERLTAAHLAALVGSVSCLEALCADAGSALVLQADAHGRTPLELATARDDTACVKWLTARVEAARELTADEENEIATIVDTSVVTTPRPPALSTMEMQNINRWGFVDLDGKEHVYEPTEKDIRKEVERGTKWLKMFDHWDDKFRGSDKLMERIDKGIPDAVRGSAWMLLVDAMPETRPADVYSNLLLHASEHASQIKKDIHRTFPRHILFRDAEGTGQQALFNVLKNFAVHDTVTGYCQGMGFVAGVLLMCTRRCAAHRVVLRR